MIKKTKIPPVCPSSLEALVLLLNSFRVVIVDQRRLYISTFEKERQARARLQWLLF